MIPQDILEVIAKEHDLSETEFKVLSHAIGGESAEAIAKQLGTEPQVIRNRLREVYKKFQIPGAGPGKLAKLQHLISEYQARSAQSASPFPTVPVPQTSQSQTADWGQAPDVSIFYGRTEDLATLQQWIVSDRCRVVALIGLAGIGKTALSVKLAQQVQREFERVIWRSLRQSPVSEDLIAEVLQKLSPTPTAVGSPRILSENLNALLSRLIDALQKSRCLLILDNVETILESGELAGQYREGYKGYGELFRRVGEIPHQSCLVLTSLEKPKEIARLEGQTLPVRSYTLKGLQKADAREILKARGLSGEDKWNTLIDFYRGNPLALKFVATRIEELFNGQVAEFLNRRRLVFGDLHDLIDYQFERLSELEKEILYWLAIEEKPCTIGILEEDIWLPISERDLEEALTSLKRRSLTIHCCKAYLIPLVLPAAAQQRQNTQTNRSYTCPACGSNGLVIHYIEVSINQHVFPFPASSVG